MAPPLLALAAAAVTLSPFAFRFTTGVMGGLGVLSGVAAALLTIEFAGDGRGAARLGGAIIIANCLVAVYGFLQYGGVDLFRWAISYGGMRPFATLGNPNYLGGHFAILFPWTVACFLYAGTPAAKVVWFSLAMSWGALVFISQTRGSWAAAGLGGLFVIAAFWLREPARIRSQRTWLSVLGGLGGLAALALAGANPEIVIRLNSLVHPEFGQVAKRATAWTAASFMVRERPLTGYGPGCFKHGYGKYLARAMPPGEKRQFVHTYSEEFAHSDPIQIVSEYGLLAFGLFIWLAVCAVRRLLEPGRSGLLVLSLAGCGVAYLVHGMFNLPLHIAPTAFLFWAGMGLAAGRAPETSRPAGGPPEKRIAAAGGVALAAGLAAVLILGASIYTRQGSDFVKFGYWAMAQRSYEKSMKVNWDDRREEFFIASMLFQRGEYGAAIPHYEKETAINPYYMDGYANLGSALGAAGRTAEAELRLRKAAELNPAYAEAYANLGVAFLQLKRLPEAADAFLTALELEPDMALAANGLAEVRKRTGKGR